MDGSFDAVTASLDLQPLAYGVFRDRSSTITIVNDHPTTTLVLKGALTADTGIIDKTPSQTIFPRGATTMRVKDNNGFFGSKGWVSYDMGGDGAEVTIFFECPAIQVFGNKNKVTATPSDHATVGDYPSVGPLLAEVRIH